jgi:hypothetical protein
MAYKGDPEKDLMCQYLDWDKKTMSLATLLDAVEDAYNNVVRNNQDPTKVPVVIRFDNINYAIPWYGVGYGVGNKGFSAFIDSGVYHKIMPIVPDVRPDGDGEYWQSRGPGYPDIAGFVKSKQAGERINEMVSEVLMTNEHKSWLDYRETEPTWIQYKFHQDEFDMDMLDKLTKENDGVITKEIIKKCSKNFGM